MQFNKYKHEWTQNWLKSMQERRQQLNSAEELHVQIIYRIRFEMSVTTEVETNYSQKIKRKPIQSPFSYLSY